MVQLKDNITLTRMYQITTRMLHTLYSALPLMLFRLSITGHWNYDDRV